MNYRDTLNLPNAEFSIPMKANLPQQEPEWQKFWDEIGLYRRLVDREAPTFILHDGPPYSNASIHMGHALNKTLKDVIARHKSLSGFRTPYVHGWDNHGMPIENAVASRFLEEGKKPDRVELRRACRAYAHEQMAIQKSQLQRLGVIGDWDRSYYTMEYGYEATEVRVFGELYQKGYIYRDLRPVMWCPVCATALAEAEIEYAEKESDSIFVRFPLRTDPTGKLGFENLYALIWTTTPWTIPANLAVALHPNLDYVVVRAGDARYLLVDSLVEDAMDAVGAGDAARVAQFKGNELEGVEFSHPLFDRASPVVLADYVLADEGTGVVHTAPGHGAEDFYTGRKYGLPILCPVDGNGRFTEEAGEFAGLPIAPEGNQRVIERLRQAGALLAHTTYAHNYPHCWRCQSPLLFRATVQWFMAIDHDGLRRRCLEAIDRVRWVPKETINRICTMVASRPDWCLSRQRSWGVGIPAFFCTECEEPYVTPDSVEAIAQLVESEGSDAWYEREASEILPGGAKCECGSASFRKETDVLDVWFDSGCSNRAVLERHPDLHWPADLYIEGSDQHRGWFNSSLIVSMATKGAPPYGTVVTNGWVTDSDGKKMSKSKGNVADPLEVCEKMGADVLRLWATSTEYSDVVRLGDEILSRVAEAYRQIRNTLRFMLANLSDFEQPVDKSEMLEIDRWAMAALQRFVAQARHQYNEYEYHPFYHDLRNFCNVDLSAFYLDAIKDRLYAERAQSLQRRSAQTALMALASTLSRIVAPVLVHTAEEVWQRLPLPDKAVSVHLSDFPTVDAQWQDEALLARWEAIREVRDLVNQKVEQAKNDKTIPNPQSAAVALAVDSERFGILDSLGDTLPALFGVSQVLLVSLNEVRDQGPLAVMLGITEDSIAPAEGVKVAVKLADGSKCARCWRVLPDVGAHGPFDEVCSRCAGALAS
ncbi:MAG: isoleucine--tRNA ligase [Armatimonadetes bacterium]|nr:isoleucine--tRNA ligase [Armatimonadota bacterium]